jgi:hypothetical protein
MQQRGKWSTLEPVLSSHLPNERLKFLVNRPSTALGVADLTARTNKQANSVDATSGRSQASHKKRITPTGEPPTGANPELSVGIAEARLRVPTLQHQQLLPRAQVLGDQQRLRLEKGRNSPNEKANHPARPLTIPSSRRGAKARDCQPHSLRMARPRAARHAFELGKRL